MLLCLPASGAEQVDLLPSAGREAAHAGPGTRFVVVQQDFGATGLARTLHLEHPSIHTTVVGLADVLPTSRAAVEAEVARVVGDVTATTGFSEVHYTEDGTRTVAVLRVLPEPAEPAGTSPLGRDDVLLVTGNGKGLTAECALAMAQDSGARLALLGPIDPATDQEVSTNLARMVAAGVQVRYERADVTDAREVRQAVERIEATLGPVTAVLHGAARNEPTALASLTGEQLRRTLAPKVVGLWAVLDAVGEDKIKLLVSLGSTVGRTGQHGQAHYATANDWTSELTVDFGRRHPDARALALEWSEWSGDKAAKHVGATPLPLDGGLAVLRRVLADPAAGPVVTVSGRTAGIPAIALEPSELPSTRFVDRVLVHYPGVELVTETELTTDDDPYLADSELRFPAVLGMEAMAQVAAALSGATTTPLLEDAEFPHPIVVRPGGATTVRLVALVTGADTVEVAIRSEDTGFTTDHVRARLRFSPEEPPAPRQVPSSDLPAVPVDPVTDLYGGILFQGKRFQRLESVREVSSRHVVAELSTTSPEPWFAAPLPQHLVLADPGRRDAVLHAIQCCVPDTTLRLVRVERLHPAGSADEDPEVVVVAARERERHGDRYVYDVDVLTTAGAPVERWVGLTLRATNRSAAGPWVPALLGPYLERAAELVLGDAMAFVVEPDRPGTSSSTVLATNRILDARQDTGANTVSASHGAGLTVVVAGTGLLSCDVEVVAEHTEDEWDTLLGGRPLPVRDLVAAATGETVSVAATRILSALACQREAGVPSNELTLDRVDPAGWVVLSDGESRIATWVTTVDDVAAPVVFAVLSESEN